MAMCKKCKNIVPPSDITNGLCSDCATDVDKKIEDKEELKKEKRIFVDDYIKKVQKSHMTSFILTLLLSPFGVFYSSIAGGIIMIVVSLLLINTVGSFGLIAVVVANIIVGSITTSMYNEKVKTKAEYDFNLMYS
jgi:hypothetical protein